MAKLVSFFTIILNLTAQLCCMEHRSIPTIQELRIVSERKEVGSFEITNATGEIKFHITEYSQEIPCGGTGCMHHRLHKYVDLAVFLPNSQEQFTPFSVMLDKWLKQYGSTNIDLKTEDEFRASLFSRGPEKTSNQSTPVSKPLYKGTFSLVEIVDVGVNSETTLARVEFNKIVGALIALKWGLKFTDELQRQILLKMSVPQDKIEELLESEQTKFSSFLAEERKYSEFMRGNLNE